MSQSLQFFKFCQILPNFNKDYLFEAKITFSHKNPFNVGDMPTRLEKEAFRHYLAFVLFATKVNIVLPPLDAWNAAFSHWATYASSSPSA